MKQKVTARDKLEALFGKEYVNELDESIRRNNAADEADWPEWLATVGAIFTAPPLEVANYLTMHSEPTQNAIRKLCDAVNFGCSKALRAESDQVLKLSKITPNLVAFGLEGNLVILGANLLTERNEKDYLLAAGKMGIAKKRMKILAALDVIRRTGEVTRLLQAEDAQHFAYPLFAYFRSITQFLFFEYYADGISVDMGRKAGSRKQKDRLGVKMLLEQLSGTNPRIREQGSYAWRTMRKELLASGLKTFDNEYALEFRPNPQALDVYSGHVLQTDPNGKPYEMSYDAFKPFFRQWKKEGDS